MSESGKIFKAYHFYCYKCFEHQYFDADTKKEAIKNAKEEGWVKVRYHWFCAICGQEYNSFYR